MSNFLDSSSTTFQLDGGRELVDVERVKVLLSSTDTNIDPYKVRLSNKSFSSDAGNVHTLINKTTNTNTTTNIIQPKRLQIILKLTKM